LEVLLLEQVVPRQEQEVLLQLEVRVQLLAVLLRELEVQV
jgi:hypothetical protein